jgi:hypothetical protein
MEFNAAPKPEDLTYYLNCEVIVKEVPYEDEQSTGTTQQTDLMVFLRIKESSQRDLFYAAWLPDMDDESHEVVCRAGNPIDGYFRCAVFRRSKNFQEKHLFVMSKGAEEELKRIPQGWNLYIEVLPQNDDTMADQAKAWEIPGQKNFDNELRSSLPIEGE